LIDRERTGRIGARHVSRPLEAVIGQDTTDHTLTCDSF
jgi:hypothetical protein